MDIPSTLSLCFHFLPLFLIVAAAFTLLCILFSLRSLPLTKRWLSSSSDGAVSENRYTCGGDAAAGNSILSGVDGVVSCLPESEAPRSSCPCDGAIPDKSHLSGVSDVGEAGVNGDILEVEDQNTEASIMEQLVPEITTHALSYLDHLSLCRLSMTNSSMRKAANDDNAWKALYHKDYNPEQDSVTPASGWKAYYAATRAIVNVNEELFSIIRERSLTAMSRLWLNTDYVKCTHATGELFSGYYAVMHSWELKFSRPQGIKFDVRDVRARVLTGMAWVTMKVYIDKSDWPFNVTNVFEFHNDRWYLVHHHSSLQLVHGD